MLAEILAEPTEDAPPTTGLSFEELVITVRRGEKGLGLIVNGANIVVELAPGGQAEEDGKLAVGDLVVAVDLMPLGDLRLRDVLAALPLLPAHTFTVRRSTLAARAWQQQQQQLLIREHEQGAQDAAAAAELGGGRPAAAAAGLMQTVAAMGSAVGRGLGGLAELASGGAGSGADRPGGDAYEVVLLGAEGECREHLHLRRAGAPARHPASSQHPGPCVAASSSELIEMAERMWTAAFGRSPRRPLRTEGVLPPAPDGRSGSPPPPLLPTRPRLLVTAATPLADLRRCEQFRVCEPPTSVGARVCRSRASKPRLAG